MGAQNFDFAFKFPHIVAFPAHNFYIFFGRKFCNRKKLFWQALILWVCVYRVRQKILPSSLCRI